MNTPYDQMKAFEAWMASEGMTWEDVMDFETWGQLVRVREMTEEELFEYLRHDQVVMDMEVVWDQVNGMTADDLEAYKQYLLDFKSSREGKGAAPDTDTDY